MFNNKLFVNILTHLAMQQTNSHLLQKKKKTLQNLNVNKSLKRSRNIWTFYHV